MHRVSPRFQQKARSANTKAAKRPDSAFQLHIRDELRDGGVTCTCRIRLRSHMHSWIFPDRQVSDISIERTKRAFLARDCTMRTVLTR